jgi:hypothetical protein
MDNDLEQRIFAELDQIGNTLAEDRSGDRARAIVAYFSAMAEPSKEQLQTALPDAERRSTAQLVECLHAAQRLVQQLWETTHMATLSRR